MKRYCSPVITADSLKEEIKKHFDEKGIKYIDLGHDSEKSVDYPAYAAKFGSLFPAARRSNSAVGPALNVDRGEHRRDPRGLRVRLVQREIHGRTTTRTCSASAEGSSNQVRSRARRYLCFPEYEGGDTRDGST
ncbi:MAG: RpiB/LacA/LacB family sugar-phosphate isomerase [Eubacteriales bacterium]